MSNPFDFCVGLINICILGFLIYKFGKEPIKAAIAERERIAREKVGEAQSMFDEAQSEFKKYEELVANIESKKIEMMDRAQRDAREYRETTAAKTEQEASEIVSKVKSEMNDARRIAKAELRAEIAKATVLQAKAILAENLDEEVHQNILEKFLTKVGG